MSQFSLTAIVVLFVTSVRADDGKKVVDPSGTWRWEHDAGGETIKDVLKLNFDGAKVTGTYKGRRNPIEIKNGKMEGDKLSCDFGVEFDGRKIVVKFKGKIKGDEVDGTVAIESDNDSREFPWKAKRSVEVSDVVGTWKMQIKTSNGNSLTPKLTLSQEDKKKKLKGIYESTNADVKLDVKEIQVKDNQLSFIITGEFDGNTLTAKYTVQPRGDKLSGKIGFKFNDRTGELKVKGKREKKKK